MFDEQYKIILKQLNKISEVDRLISFTMGGLDKNYECPIMITARVGSLQQTKRQLEAMLVTDMLKMFRNDINSYKKETQNESG